MRYVKTGHCIWCGKTEPDVSFRAAPHIVPHNLGSDDIGFDVCYYWTLYGHTCCDSTLKIYHSIVYYEFSHITEYRFACKLFI